MASPDTDSGSSVKSILKNNQPPAPRLYFAYGSNLSVSQMQARCPSSTYIGVAALEGWTWIINERGHANMVEQKHLEPPALTAGVDPPPFRHREPGLESVLNPVVYGIVYEVAAPDERLLDAFEDVPARCTKELLPVRVWSDAALQDGGDQLEGPQFTTPDPEAAAPPPTKLPLVGACEVKDVLVYVDRKRLVCGEPRAEYGKRLCRGVIEAAGYGMPVDWMLDTIGDFVNLDSALEP